MLARVALSHAESGADMVAPSGMMDGMVTAIRQALDENGFEHIPILSYSVKYASSFYGPFREATEGAPKFGDRKTHQMDPANVREALREAALDIEEDADMLAPQVWQALMEKLPALLSDYLVAQIRAGAQAVQVFDSWVGSLSPQDYEQFVLPYTRQLIQDASQEGAHLIYFGVNTVMLLRLMKRTSADVIGLDWRIPLDEGWQILGEDCAVQGNLDPVALLAPLPCSP